MHMEGWMSRPFTCGCIPLKPNRWNYKFCFFSLELVMISLLQMVMTFEGLSQHPQLQEQILFHVWW